VLVDSSGHGENRPAAIGDGVTTPLRSATSGVAGRDGRTLAPQHAELKQPIAHHGRERVAGVASDRAQRLDAIIVQPVDRRPAARRAWSLAAELAMPPARADDVPRD
jgi:hypothetical protein